MADNPLPPQETLEQMQARHRKEAKDLQGRVTSKKKNATKKTRKGVNDECAELERQMRERQAEEVRTLQGGGDTTAAAEEESGHSDGDDKAVTAEAEEETTGDDVAAKLGALRAGGGAPAKIQSPAPTQEEEDNNSGGGGGGGANGGGGGGGGKKRNRQKERLARRAAEQEAAAAAAEQEAAGMTDHRGAERERMAAEFARRGLVEREIRPDGHCLFSAVADQLGAVGIPTNAATTRSPPSMGGGGRGTDGDEEPAYRTVRRRAAGYIEAHGDEYAGFLEEDLGAYVRKMRDTAEWGGQLELLALASVYGVEICVVQAGGVEVVQPATATATANGTGEGEGEERKKIWLAYYRHGYGLGEHYNSLRQKA